MVFEVFKFDPSIMAGVQALGYIHPTPIQNKSIPPIMQGSDLIGLAQTGTGKTAAFVLPILHRLLPGKRDCIRALILSPTRELTEQTCEAISGLGQQTDLRGISIYGGVNMEKQTRRLRDGVEIVVACPGRLLDHLRKRNIGFPNLEMLVIDEADRMLDMGFLPDVKSILKRIPNKRQTLLFSATMPDDIKRLAREIMHDPVTIQIGHVAPADTVSHTLFPVKQHLKTALLKEILKRTETNSVLVFTRTKHRAKRVAQQLLRDGYSVTSLQGNMHQNRRQAALNDFRTGIYKILVATDIAARGIDVMDISHVVNYDMPDSTDAYTHRIGRTGRIGKTGEAFTFVTGEDKTTVKALARMMKEPLEQRTLPGFNYLMPAPDNESARR
jgi:ATP-dependent RNA helicase RhlE